MNSKENSSNNDTDAKKAEGCTFCNPTEYKIVYENSLAFAVYDKYPVTRYHLLILPKRHIAEYFDISSEEVFAINEILLKAKKEISENDASVTGFNIGINNGRDAGQTIFHCHMHLIPRRTGDIDDPTGGIRNIFPGKGNYKKNSLSG